MRDGVEENVKKFVKYQVVRRKESRWDGDCIFCSICVCVCFRRAPVRRVVSHLSVVKVADIGVVKVGDLLLARHRTSTREAVTLAAPGWG